MKFTKKLVALLLLVCMTVSLLPAATLVAGAAYTDDELRNMIAETALAYFYKGPDVQYDNYPLSGAGYGMRWQSALQRLTYGASPEDAAPDYTYYTICSAFVNDVYKNVFGFNICNSKENRGYTNGKDDLITRTGINQDLFTEDELQFPLSIQNVTDGFAAYANRILDDGNIIIAAYQNNTYKNLSKTELNELLASLQTGDMIVAFSGAGEESGHTMMFLKDFYGGYNYIIHSGGANELGNKYNANGFPDHATTTQDYLTDYRGFDIPEAVQINRTNSYNRSSTITMERANNMLGYDQAYGPGRDPGSIFFIRPLNIAKQIGAATPSPSAVARLAYPSIEITKTSNPGRYNDIVSGGQITYTVTIENNTNNTMKRPGVSSQTYTGITLEEAVPEGTSFVSATNDGTYAGGKVSWSGISVPAGGKKELSYTVQVTAPAGSTVVSPHGTLSGTSTDGYFTTSELENPVGMAHPANFSTSLASVSATTSDTQFAEAYYAALGYDVDLPTAQEILDELVTNYYFPYVDKVNENLKYFGEPVDPEDLTDEQAITWSRMIVPGFVGGYSLQTMDENGIKSNKNRLTVFSDSFLQPGDVIVRMNRAENTFRTVKPGTVQTHVYLGSGKYAAFNGSSGAKLVTAPYKLYKYDENATSATPKYWQEYTPTDRNTPAAKKSSIWGYSSVLSTLFLSDYFFVLRPSLVQDLGSASTMELSTQADEETLELMETAAVKNTRTGTTYSTMTAAVSAASSGDTLLMLRDMDVTDEPGNYTGGAGEHLFNITKSLTIDFGGYTMTDNAARNQSVFRIRPASSTHPEDTSVTIKNGTAYVKGAKYFTNTSANTVLKDMKIYSDKHGVYTSSDKADPNMCLMLDGTTVVAMLGSASTGTDYYAILMTAGTAELTNGSTLASKYLAYYLGAGTTLILTDGKLASGIPSANRKGRISGTAASASVEVGVTTKKTGTQQLMKVDAGKQILLFQGDTYEVDAAARINGKNYATVEAALDDAKAGDTIELLDDCNFEGAVTVKEGVTVEFGDYKMTFGEDGEMTVYGTVNPGTTKTDPDTIVLKDGGVYDGIGYPQFAEPTTKAVHPDKNVKLSSYSLSLKDATVLNTYAIPEEIGHTDCKALVVGPDSTEEIDAELKDGSWHFPIARSCARQMVDIYTTQLLADDGEDDLYVGKTVDLSILGYAKQMISPDGAGTLSKALISMLNYGAEAQKTWNYRTDNLANKDITQKQQEAIKYKAEDLNPKDSGKIITNEDSVFVGTSAVLKDYIHLRFYVKLSTHPVGGVTAEISYKDSKGINRQIMPELIKKQDEGANFYYCAAELMPTDFHQIVTFTLTQGTTELVKVEDSLESYIARASQKDDGTYKGIFDALQIYCLSAMDEFRVPEKEENELAMN